MSIGSRIMNAITPIISEAAPQVYTEKALEYATYNFNRWPELFAEGEPDAIKSYVQVHYYMPHGKDPEETLRQLTAALFAAGFTWPSVTDASDRDGQHYVLECQDVEGRERGEAGA